MYVLFVVKKAAYSSIYVLFILFTFAKWLANVQITFRSPRFSIVQKIKKENNKKSTILSQNQRLLLFTILNNKFEKISKLNG